MSFYHSKAAQPAYAQSVDVKTHTQKAIKEYVKEHPLDPAVTYTKLHHLPVCEYDLPGWRHINIRNEGIRLLSA